ncbi:MAG TPA: dipeptidase [Candidatus Limnocylindria bacterium]|jgi:membrane dipeptidase|nr:dipeptidase [Candidatus Limnocylindria bacterium]
MRVARILVYSVFLAGTLVWSAFAQDHPVSARARVIHNSAIVVDTHEDTPQRFLDEDYDIGSIDPKDEDFISLDKARAGNLSAEFFSVFVDPRTNQGHFAKRALELIDSVYNQAARHPERMMMSFSADDIERAHEQHKLASLMGIEGGHSIENDLHLLHDYYRLGVRYITLAWSNTNEWADSCGDLCDPKIPHHDGLTDFGKQVVLEMNRIGMMVDISHVSDKTFWDAIATTKSPLIASHSSARALRDTPRNLTDKMLRAVAKNGGVVNVAFANMFLDQEFSKAALSQHQQMLTALEAYKAKRRADGQPVTPEDSERFNLEWLGKNKIPRAPLKSLIDHIDHVTKVAGVDHVGLGSDFNGTNFFPEGIDSAADLPKITQVLLERGYAPSDVKKILGGNMLRVFRDVERVSLEMRTRH